MLAPSLWRLALALFTFSVKEPHRLEKQASARRMLVLARPRQRRLSIGGGTARVSTRLQQSLSACLVAILARRHQRRFTVVACTLGVGARLLGPRGPVGWLGPTATVWR